MSGAGVSIINNNNGIKKKTTIIPFAVFNSGAYIDIIEVKNTFRLFYAVIYFQNVTTQFIFTGNVLKLFFFNDGSGAMQTVAEITNTLTGEASSAELSTYFFNIGSIIDTNFSFDNNPLSTFLRFQQEIITLPTIGEGDIFIEIAYTE
jgi:hypothetical protein